MASKPTFNATNDNIEWAKWSWNPITGCKTLCAYCYARDIAMRYTGHFDPEFHADRLQAPANTKIPRSKVGTPGINNVFVGSMCDMFGEWVPDEWIELVLEQVAANQQWTYLFLTKNPERYLHIKFPSKCWLGATADTQAHAERALDVFHHMQVHGTQPAIRFLSVEPMLEPICLYNAPFREAWIDWLIIGGCSKTNKVPASQPQWQWVYSLIRSVQYQKVKVYFKPNLTVRPKEYPTR